MTARPHNARARVFAIATGLCLSLASAVASPQTAGTGLVAYDICAYTLEYVWSCSIYITGANGSGLWFLEDGTEPAWSADGSRLAYTGYQQPGIVVVNLSDWSAVQVTASGSAPAWSPDGASIAFSADDVFVMDADGSNVRQVTNGIEWAGRPSWLPDGQRLVFECIVDIGNIDICSSRLDGTDFERLTTSPAQEWAPAVSPDGTQIAFVTIVGDSYWVSIMNADGSGAVGVVQGLSPAWSPDGSQLIYVSAESGACDADGICQPPIRIVNVDGTDDQWFAWGDHPAWVGSHQPLASFYLAGCNGLACSFDTSSSWTDDPGTTFSWNFGDGATGSGPNATHTYAGVGTYTVTMTLTTTAGVSGSVSREITVTGNLWPIASFTVSCVNSFCTFDASASSDPDGSIAFSYWNFGDGSGIGSAGGVSASHFYEAAGTYTVWLTVYDNFSAWGQTNRTVAITAVVNQPPIASFTTNCQMMFCSFNPAGSSDPDGGIVAFAWNFGDGATSPDYAPSHVYAAAGTYTVSLVVTDTRGATGATTRTVTAVAPPPPIHVGDIDGFSTAQKNTWTATAVITVHDINHAPVANALVTGNIDGIATACTTGANGQCSVQRTGLSSRTTSVFFSISYVSHATFPYQSDRNHDPDGDGTGFGVQIFRR